MFHSGETSRSYQSSERVQVERVGVEPVDRREVPALRELRVEGPEDLDDAERVLRDRLGEVAAGRRDRADDRDRARVAVERGHEAGALVELGEPGREVRGIPLFAGHLLEPARDLAHGLGPARGRVGHQRDVVAHVAEVLGDGDPGVDRGLARRDGHVRGVRDQDRPLHERLARLRVLEVGELGQHLGHLVAAFAAADVDHDLGVGPLGELLLRDRLARAERPGDGGRTALRDREEAVEDPLSRDERDRRVLLLADGPRHPDGPPVHHLELGAVLEGRDRLLDRVAAALDGLRASRPSRSAGP